MEWLRSITLLSSVLSAANPGLALGMAATRVADTRVRPIGSGFTERRQDDWLYASEQAVHALGGLATGKLVGRGCVPVLNIAQPKPSGGCWLLR